jgi:phosphoribosylglycinamide formyltransferase-1
MLINLHYSLLPAFAGLIGIEPIKKAYEQGCKFMGPTCHLVDEGVDTGEILAQGVFKADRPFQELVTMMFRSGCLVLLNALLLSMGHCKEFEASRTIFFSPELTFDKFLFDEEFWQKVASS